MTRIRFEDLPSTNTPRNATNLNKLNNVVISSTEPTTGEEVWVQKGKNLFDKNKIINVNGKILDSNGNEINDTSGGYTKMYISVNPNTNYTISGLPSLGSKGIYFFNNSKTYISQTEYFSATSKTFTTPNDCYYLDIMYYLNGNDFNTYQLEQDSTATSYEPYIDKKIYAKNDNGVYEEFYDESEINTIGIINTNYGVLYYSKNNNLVHLEGNLTGIVGTYVAITTLPNNLKPKMLSQNWNWLNENTQASVGINNSTGVVYAYHHNMDGGAYVSSDVLYLNTTYLTD